MGIWKGWGLGSLGLIMSALVPAAPQPPQVFGELPSLEDVALSPDGAQIAFVRTHGETRELRVASLREKKAAVGLVLGQSKLRLVQWADNQHVWLLLTTTATPMGIVGPAREWATLSVLDVVTHKLTNPLGGIVQGLSRDMNVVLGSPLIRTVGTDTFLYVTGLGTPGVTGEASIGGRLTPSLIKVNVSSGNARLEASGESGSRDWFVDELGNVVAEQRYDGGSQRWSILLHQKGSTRQQASGRESIDIPSIAGIAPSGDGVWVRTLENEEPIWKTLSFQDGSWGEVPDEAKGLDSVITDRRTGRIVGGLRFADQTTYQFFDDRRGEIWSAVLKAFPNSRVLLSSASDNFNNLIVRVEKPGQGPLYMLVDIGAGSAQLLGKVYEDLDRAAEVRAISYKAQDGLMIPAFLTLPPDRPETRLPLIVMPHGGPQTRDVGNFDWFAQALAAQGYAVLQPNYRGSTLSGQFLAAGFGQWGRKMQTDLSDGVSKLVADGLVDPARVCIVGASYGGYAALAGVTLQSGVYRCAVAVAGISDLHLFLSRTSDMAGRNARIDRYLDRFLGVSGPNDPHLEEISPASHLAAVTAPILLVHGRDDTVVPFEQSERVAEDLRKAGKNVTLVELKEEDHWLSRRATRLQMLQATVDFLQINNPPN
jgi:dipeptidyl aminopeptidase/acylaminoacyl peptidase